MSTGPARRRQRARRITADGTSHSIGTVRSAPDGTLCRAGGTATRPTTARGPPRVRTFDGGQAMAGKLMHIDRNGMGLPGHSFCPAESKPRERVNKSHAKGLPKPFPLQLRPAAASRWATWAGQLGGDRPGRRRRRELRVALLEGSGRTPGYEELPQCEAQYANPHRAPVHQYPHGGSRAILGGPTYTGSAYPAGYGNSIFFGDYAGGFIRRLVPNGGGWSSQDFATGWSGTALESDADGNLVYASVGNFGNGQARAADRLFAREPESDRRILRHPELGDRAADGCLRRPPTPVERSRRRPAHLQLGLRRRDPRQQLRRPLAHLSRRRHLHRAPDGVRRPGRKRHSNPDDQRPATRHRDHRQRRLALPRRPGVPAERLRFRHPGATLPAPL